MFKKILMVSALVFVGVSSAHARIGVGAFFGGQSSWHGWGWNNDVGLSLGLGEMGETGTWDFGLKFWGGNNLFRISGHGDYIFLGNKLFDVDWFGWYLGGGIYASMSIISGSVGGFGLDVGGRLPVGIRFTFVDHVDIWLALVPNIGLFVGFGDAYSNRRLGIGGGIGAEFGIRYWF